MKLRRIVFINQVTAYLFIDIVNSFCSEYEEVILFAGEVKPMMIPLNSKVKVITIAKYNKKNIITRSLSWFKGFVKSVFLLNIYFRGYDVFVSSNPPLLNFINLFCTNKVSLLVYDVYPDGLVAGGFIKKNGIIFKIWKFLNKKSFKSLVSITTISNGMANALSSYVDLNRVKVIPVWSSRNFLNKENKIGTNEFLNKNNLHDKFLIVYSGNLGLGYDLEILVELANIMKENKSIHFVIAGEGIKKGSIEKLLKGKKLINFSLISYQPSNLFLSMMEAIDLGVVFQDKKAFQIAIPSKTYNLLSMGKPLISFGSKETELADLIKESRSGETFDLSSVGEIESFILKLYHDKDYYNRLSRNALAASSQFTCKNADLVLKNHLNV